MSGQLGCRLQKIKEWGLSHDTSHPGPSACADLSVENGSTRTLGEPRGEAGHDPGAEKAVRCTVSTYYCSLSEWPSAGEAVGERALRARAWIGPTEGGDLAKILKLQTHLPFDHRALSSRNLSHKFAREQNDPRARQFILALFVTSRRHPSTCSDN